MRADALAGLSAEESAFRDANVCFCCRFAFVEFATVAEAEKALKSTENMKIRKREIRAEFCQKQKSDLGEGAFPFTSVLSFLVIETGT